jgi:hypothetical protein
LTSRGRRVEDESYGIETQPHSQGVKERRDICLKHVGGSHRNILLVDMIILIKVIRIISISYVLGTALYISSPQ